MKFKPFIATLLSASLVGLLAACGGSAGTAGGTTNGTGDGTTTITVGIQDKWNPLPLMAAIDQGFTEQSNITVETITFTDIAAMSAALKKGQIDAAFQSAAFLSSLNADSDQPEYKIFAPGVGAATLFLTADENDPNVDWESVVRSWEGKTVGVPALGGLIGLIVDYMVRSVGEDPAKFVTVVPVGLGEAAAAALKANKVDVINASAPGAAQLQAQGEASVALNTAGDNSPPLLADVTLSYYMASIKNLDSMSTELRALAESLEQGRDFIQDPANSDEIVNLLQELRVVADASTAEILAKEYLDVFDTSSTVDAVQTTFDALTEMGALPTPVPAAAEVTVDYTADQ